MPINDNRYDKIIKKRKIEIVISKDSNLFFSVIST